MYTVTVDTAIQKGKVHLVYIPMILFIGSIAAGVYFTSYVNEWYVIAGSFVLGASLAWFYWSLAVTRWKIWAFGNVRNVHELKRRAVREKLIWPEGNMFAKTEIRTKGQKEMLFKLDRKFEHEDIFRDDISVPKETLIYYSRSNSIIEFAIGVVVMIIGILLFSLKNNRYIITFVCLTLGLYIIIKSYKRLSDKKPQLIITAEGIEAAEFGFVSWENIYEWEIINRSKTDYLEINNGYYSIEIDSLKISRSRLSYLLELYKQRHAKTHT